ncbi:MAG: hypothetical protein KBG25_07735 [Paludibacteraceae bacterium]|nr:hypothetical protein [Paludibacteraceae bacterium]
MLQEITIEKTSNFWIDNGIVGLYKVLRLLPEAENFDIRLESDKLEIKTLNDSLDVADFLNKAKNYVTQQYLKKTDNYGWILKNDGRFEIYRKTDFKMHLKPFFTGKTPNTEGAICTPDANEKENVRRMNNDEYSQFLSFQENIFLNISEKIKLGKRGFINSPPKYEIGSNFTEEFIKKGRKQCSFSGKQFKIANTITGMNYPFLTGNSGELNFDSALKMKPTISALYDFVSLFSFYNLNYLLQDDLKHYFILYDNNLKELESFYDIINANINNLTKPDFCSFETQIVGTQYESESLFNFLLSIYAQVNQRINRDKRRGILLSKSVFTLSNDGNIFRDVKEYTSLNALFELFDCFENYQDDERSYREPFLNFIRYFAQRLDSGKYDTTWRNRLCSDILSFRSILKTVEWFMGEVKMKEEKGNILFLDKIIEIYNFKTQINMKTEMVDICKAVGNHIGAYCRENDDKGILFSIRNAKSRTEFLNVLAETQFRTGVSYSETFFKELPDNSQWEEYKALVSIFAMNSFLFKEKKITENQ